MTDNPQAEREEAWDRFRASAHVRGSAEELDGFDAGWAAGRAETEQALRDLVRLVSLFELAWGTVGKPDREITGDAMALFAGLKAARAFLTREGAEDA